MKRKNSSFYSNKWIKNKEKREKIVQGIQLKRKIMRRMIINSDNNYVIVKHVVVYFTASPKKKEVKKKKPKIVSMEGFLRMHHMYMAWL